MDTFEAAVHEFDGYHLLSYSVFSLHHLAKGTIAKDLYNFILVIYLFPVW
jgi:hypothetical protein